MGNHTELMHIALEIQQNDLKDFYQDILQGEVIYERTISNDTIKKLFGIDTSVKTYVVRCDNIDLELFVYHNSNNQTFSHVCINTDMAEEISQKALQKAYYVKKWQNRESQTYFIKDRNGNMFELKKLK